MYSGRMLGSCGWLHFLRFLREHIRSKQGLLICVTRKPSVLACLSLQYFSSACPGFPRALDWVEQHGCINFCLQHRGFTALILWYSRSNHLYDMKGGGEITATLSVCLMSADTQLWQPVGRHAWLRLSTLALLHLAAQILTFYLVFFDCNLWLCRGAFKLLFQELKAFAQDTQTNCSGECCTLSLLTWVWSCWILVMPALLAESLSLRHL